MLRGPHKKGGLAKPLTIEIRLHWQQKWPPIMETQPQTQLSAQQTHSSHIHGQVDVQFARTSGVLVAPEHLETM